MSIAGRLGRLLLVRLAVQRHPIDRERLVDDLWGGEPPRAADSVLNATFSRLRTALATVGLDGRALLLSHGGVAELRRPPGMRIDLEAAHRAIDAAEGHLRAGRTSDAWSHAVVAHAVAQRPILPGEDRIWLDVERDRLGRVLERSLAVLTDVWLARGDPDQGVLMARELVRRAPLSEASHQRLVGALLAQGDRGAAAEAVTAWERTMADELGLAADDRLRRLLRGE